MKTLRYLALSIPAILVCMLVFYSTRWGPGVGYDSMFYLDGAVNIAGGKGVYWIGSGGELKPLTHYPPFYSIVMAVPLTLGMNLLSSARLTAVLISTLNALLIAFIFYRLTSKIWFSVLATILLVLYPVIFQLYVLVMSEPLFFFWLLLGFYLLSEYLAQSRIVFLLTAAMVFALAGLTRYAGTSALIVGMIGVFLLETGSIKERLKPAVVLGTLSMLPISLWMLRNFLLTGSATNRTFEIHLIDMSDLGQLLAVIVDWFTSVHFSHWVEGIALIVFFAGATLYLAWRIWIKGEGSQKTLAFGLMISIFPVIYLFQLLVSLSFFDASTRLNDRILSPVFLSIGLIFFLLPTIPKKTMTHRLQMVILLIIAGLVFGPRIAGETTEIARSMHAVGFRFSSKAWQESELIQWIRARGLGATIVTNQAMPVRFLTGVPAIQVPEKWDPVKDQERSDYQDQIQSIRRIASQEDAYVVLFAPRDVSVRQDRDWLEDFELLFRSNEGEVFVYGKE